MKFKSLMTAAAICSGLVVSTAIFSSCTPMITEEQLALLQDLRKKERTLNQDILTKQSEISKIEAEVNAKQGELNDCTKKKEFVMQKLQQWPNVWPDAVPAK